VSILSKTSEQRHPSEGGLLALAAGVRAIRRQVHAYAAWDDKYAADRFTVSGSTSVKLDSALISSFYNPYAAVPSMHVGFAVAIASAAALAVGRRSLSLAWFSYPLLVVFVIVVTGNHFFIDAIAGALVAAVAAAIVMRLEPGRNSWEPQAGAVPQAGGIPAARPLPISMEV
jgi:membrane-associated phospholipid phosphatase